MNSCVTMNSVVSSKPIFDFKLDNVSLCVVRTNNRDDVEIQFIETENADKRRQPCADDFSLSHSNGGRG